MIGGMGLGMEFHGIFLFPLIFPFPIFLIPILLLFHMCTGITESCCSREPVRRFMLR